MSLKKVLLSSGEIQARVWMHKPTARLGIVLAGTWIGDLWLFAEHETDEVLDQSFCNFLDDPRDENSLSSKDFVDLGPL